MAVSSKLSLVRHLQFSFLEPITFAQNVDPFYTELEKDRVCVRIGCAVDMNTFGRVLRGPEVDRYPRTRLPYPWFMSAENMLLLCGGTGNIHAPSFECDQKSVYSVF